MITHLQATVGVCNIETLKVDGDEARLGLIHAVFLAARLHLKLHCNFLQYWLGAYLD